MRKLGLMLFPVTFLGWLLALIPARRRLITPPLQATGIFSSNTIYVTVYDPRLQKEQGFFRHIGGASVEIVDWKQQGGVMSWTLRNGTAYFVICCVYDPDSATFKEDEQGPYRSVSQLQVLDGVVAYVAGMPPLGGSEVFRDQIRHLRPGQTRLAEGFLV